MDAVFRPGIDTPITPTIFNNLDMGKGGSSESPIVLDEEEDMNSPPTIPLSERPTEPPRLPDCSEVFALEDELEMCRNLLKGLFVNKIIVCVCVFVIITSN